MLETFERYPLTFGSTYSEKLERIGTHLGGRDEVYARLEYCTSGLAFSEAVRLQEKELGFAFDYIVVCTVTGSTHAGMLVGFAKDGRERNVIGIDASCTPAQTKAQVLEIARNTAKLVELGREIVEDDVVLLEDYAHPVYG